MKVNKISVDDVWEMIWKAWELARVNYSLTLLVVLLYIIIMACGSIPGVGFVLTSFVTIFLPLVGLIVGKEWENGRPGSVDFIVNKIKDKETLNQMKPIMIFYFVFSLLSGALNQFEAASTMGLIGISFVTTTVSVITGVAYALLYFNKETRMGQAFELAVQGCLKNFFPLFIGGILLAVISAISMLLLILPFFLITLPIFTIYNYLWYRLVYEDLTFKVEGPELI